jgi:hypothetical protein
VTITAIFSSCGQRETVACMNAPRLFHSRFKGSKACPEQSEGSFFRGRRSFEAQDARSAHL